MIPAMVPKFRLGVAGSLAAVAALACLPATARADAGIPMLPISHETMLFFLLLVIIIEIIYLTARLKTRFRRTLLAVATVNVATMGLGFPIVWGLYAILDAWAQFPGGMSGAFTNNQFIPYWVCQKMFPDLAGMHGEIYVILGVFVTLLVPSYVITRMIKTWVFEWYGLLHYEGDDLRLAVMSANRLSYVLIALTGCMLIFRIFNGPATGGLFH
jgi:hypothetical protein